MTTKTLPFDVTRYLVDDETIANYLDDCLEEGGSRLFLAAIGDVARARGMSELAASTGLTRTALYKSLGESGNPAFATMERVLDGLGLRLAVVQKEAGRKTTRDTTGRARVAAKRHATSTIAEKRPAAKKKK